MSIVIETAIPLGGSGSTSKEVDVNAQSGRSDAVEGIVIKDDEDTDDRFSFGTLHAALGQSFVQDRMKRRQVEEESLQKREPAPGITDRKEEMDLEKCDEMKKIETIHSSF